MLAAVLLLACQGWQSSDPQSAITESRANTILNLALNRALVERKIPDFGLLANPKKVVLADHNLPKGWTSNLSGIEIIVMSKAEIESLANKNGDFLFIHVSELEFPDENSASVRINSMWAKAMDSKVIYLSGGGFAVLYEKRGETWTETSSARWIS